LAAELIQERVVQSSPQSGFGPLTEAAVRGLERYPERGRQTNRSDNRSTTAKIIAQQRSITT
jgi:hypothetical protein